MNISIKPCKKPQQSKVKNLEKQIKQLQSIVLQQQQQINKSKPKPKPKPKPNPTKHFAKPETVKRLIDNPSGELPIYHRLSNAFKQGGVHRVNKEYERIINELSSQIRIHENIIKIFTTEQTSATKNFYHSEKKYLWFIFENFIRRCSKEYQYDYGYFKVRGRNVQNDRFWKYFSFALHNLFRTPNHFCNLDNYDMEYLDCQREILRYCLMSYRTWYMKEKNKNLKPLFLYVNSGGNSKNYKISLMDRDVDGILRLI